MSSYAKDPLDCVRLSLEKLPRSGEMRISNQFVETFTVNELAQRMKQVGDELGLQVEIRTVENPRKEGEDHYYNPTHTTGLLELGLASNHVTDEALAEMIEAVQRHKERIQGHQVYRRVSEVGMKGVMGKQITNSIHLVNESFACRA